MNLNVVNEIPKRKYTPRKKRTNDISQTLEKFMGINAKYAKIDAIVEGYASGNSLCTAIRGHIINTKYEHIIGVKFFNNDVYLINLLLEAIEND